MSDSFRDAMERELDAATEDLRRQFARQILPGPPPPPPTRRQKLKRWWRNRVMLRERITAFRDPYWRDEW